MVLHKCFGCNCLTTNACLLKCCSCVNRLRAKPSLIIIEQQAHMCLLGSKEKRACDSSVFCHSFTEFVTIFSLFCLGAVGCDIRDSSIIVSYDISKILNYFFCFRRSILNRENYLLAMHDTDCQSSSKIKFKMQKNLQSNPL